jgi:hypothetical protein
MTLSTPTRLRPLSFGAVNLHGKPAATRQHVLMVEFTSTDGRRWQAIGGGDTLADAIAFAHDSCPADATWNPAGWNDAYGD